MFNFLNPDVLLHSLIYMTPAIIIGLTFHEFAHAYMAYMLGDNTARYQGRLTLNPAAHIDVIGLIMIYIAHFGWAKPVPFNPYNLKGNKDRGIILVSLAGPLMNLLLAVLAAVLYGSLHDLIAGKDYYLFFIYAIQINVFLAVFNLIPIPPLDGSKILAYIIPGSKEWLYKIEQYGMLILILLLFTGVFGFILRFVTDPVLWVLNLIANLFNSIF